MSADDWTWQAGEVLAHHWMSVTGGQCSCGHVVPLGRLVTEHLADVLRTLVEERERQAAMAALLERDRLAETLRLRSEALSRMVAENERLRSTLAELLPFRPCTGCCAAKTSCDTARERGAIACCPECHHLEVWRDG